MTTPKPKRTTSRAASAPDSARIGHRESSHTPTRDDEAAFRLGPPGREDDLAELLGEAYVQSVTSGSPAAEDFRDELLTEEEGGPYVETSAEDEMIDDIDDTNVADAEPAERPVVSAQPRSAPVRPDGVRVRS